MPKHGERECECGDPIEDPRAVECDECARDTEFLRRCEEEGRRERARERGWGAGRTRAFGLGRDGRPDPLIH